MKILKNVLVFLLAAAVLFGVNALTAPVITEHEASSQFGAFTAALPGSANFEELSLEGTADTIKGIYAETSGLGYAIDLSTTQGYTGEPIEFILGVNADGTVAGVSMVAYGDSKDFGEEYPLTYIGKDSALEGVELVASVTFSSSAFKNAVSDGLNALISNDLIQAGVKSDDQVLMELVAQVLPGIVNKQGIPQYTGEELMIANNGSCCAAIASDGSASYLVVGNIAGDVIVYDVDGNDVTASVSDSVKAAVAGAGLVSTAAEDETKLKALAGDGAELEEIALNGVFNSVTSAFRVTVEDAVYYGFGTRPYAYSNELMPVYYLLDENGAIVKMTSPEFILHSEYFSKYTLDTAEYKAAFEGVTADSFSDELALISGATMSSDGVSTATRDVFNAFSAVVGGAK